MVPDKTKECVLDDKICISCGECDRCELNPEKTCDNCCDCIAVPENDYAAIVIDDILFNTEDLPKPKRKKE